MPTSSEQASSTSVEASGTPRPILAWGNFVFRYRDYLLPIALAAIVVGSRPHPLFGDAKADHWLDALGLGVALAGQSLRWLVIGLAYIKRGGINKQIAADELVTEGVFAHCRHPLYVGNFLLVLGIIIVWNSVLAYAVAFLVMGFSLYSMALAEEAFLLKRFGTAYRDYMNRVNRFVPNLRGFRETLRGFHFDWKRVIRKEYGTTFTWTTAAIIFIGAERIMWHGMAAESAALRSLLITWLLIAALWATARILKKTGLLGNG